MNLGRVVSGGPWNPDHATVAALFADARGVAADCEAGKYKAEACAACHGEKGISPPESTPSLAGQPDQFLKWQLISFCGGMRKYGIMEPVAIAVTAVVGLIAYPLLQPAWVMVK